MLLRRSAMQNRKHAFTWAIFWARSTAFSERVGLIGQLFEIFNCNSLCTIASWWAIPRMSKRNAITLQKLCAIWKVLFYVNELIPVHFPDDIGSCFRPIVYEMWKVCASFFVIGSHLGSYEITDVRWRLYVAESSRQRPQRKSFACTMQSWLPGYCLIETVCAILC
jgi:hypothetical protein